MGVIMRRRRRSLKRRMIGRRRRIKGEGRMNSPFVMKL